MKLTDEEILGLAQDHGVLAYERFKESLAIAKRQREIDAALCLDAPIKTARQDQREACANAILNQ